MLLERMQALLERRKQQQAFRKAINNQHLIDFSSNDYLSLARNKTLQDKIHTKSTNLPLGSTGSRLLTGHYDLLEKLEEKIADFHQAPAALVFNSGYNANLALLSCLPRRGDIILYDELVHASIHDGMKMGAGTAIAFLHNDLENLETLLNKHADNPIFVIVESIYSMDGDAAPLKEIGRLCQNFSAHLIVDEAHSTGIFGKKGEGLCVELGIENQIFARLHTFGKAIGGHGAAIVGSTILRDYLFNYARPLIYSTALSPHSVLSVLEAYEYLEAFGNTYIPELQERIEYFRQLILPLVGENYINSSSPIQSIIISGNEQVVQLSESLQNAGFDIRPIRTPTVPVGKERIRICLHRHNSLDEISRLVAAISGGGIILSV